VSREHRSRVRLPADAHPPFEVYVNGVPQQEGADFEIDGVTLVFDRSLEREGKLGFWRWLSMLLGIAGTYRKNDTVDVIYTRAGNKVVASGLSFAPEPEPD
jgi:hypothetical protein